MHLQNERLKMQIENLFERSPNFSRDAYASRLIGAYDVPQELVPYFIAAFNINTNLMNRANSDISDSAATQEIQKLISLIAEAHARIERMLAQGLIDHRKVNYLKAVMAAMGGTPNSNRHLRQILQINQVREFAGSSLEG